MASDETKPVRVEKPRKRGRAIPQGRYSNSKAKPMETDLTTSAPSFRTAAIGFVMSLATMTSLMVLLGTVGA